MNHRSVKILQIFCSIYKNTILIKLLWLTSHININSLRNKFDMLTNSVSEYIDILMISETKLDDTFSHALYHLKDFKSI